MCITTRIAVAYAVWSLFLVAGAFFYVRRYWRRFKKLGQPFNYRITDIWAAMIGIVPTWILAVFVLRDTSNPQPAWQHGVFSAVLVLRLFIYQVCGLVVGRIHFELLPVERRNSSALGSAVSIITGAMISIIVLAVALILGCIAASLIALDF